MIILTAELKHLDILSKLFDEYRVFYERESDIEAAKNFMKHRLENKDSVIFIALDGNGNGMGFTQLYPSFTSVGMQRMWILNDLFVNENYRKQKVAESLLNKAEQHAKETGAFGMLLETRNTNIPAQNLYDKLGWYRDTEHTWFFKPADEM
ncbi:MAG TPA: GNAT family N-acetyltransferase [Ignavibacteria bacterium]|nr:GNAT family N-acetyltransferase [Ignavibacteria bacterium]